MSGSGGTAALQTELLERAHELSALEGLLTALPRRGGRLVLLGGEAGSGKTVLLRRFVDGLGSSGRVLWGACEPLFMPRPLGPFVEIAKVVGGELRRLVSEGARPYEVAAELASELDSTRQTVLVLEDLHWADEATLDVLMVLGRRIETLPVLLLASYRDTELDRGHPLRLALGEFTTSEAILRMKVAPLSAEAVAKLAEPYAVDPVELYDKTAGNPFFVTAVLAAGIDEIPDTVKDAVFARAARCSPAAKRLLDAVAIIPRQVEPWLLEALAGQSIDALDECLASGLLTALPNVAFRHELARLAVEEALSTPQRVRLHRRALETLTDPPTGALDLARLAHHAEAAGDAEAVLRFALPAAAEAARLGAHRESAGQYRRALRFADTSPAATRVELLERYADECFLTGRLDESIEAQRQAVEGARLLGDATREGDLLRRLAKNLWWAGRSAEAREVAHQAVTVLEREPPGRALAISYCFVAQLCQLAEDPDEAIAWGTRALELAERLDDSESRRSALSAIGATEVASGDPAGIEKLLRSLQLSQAAGVEEDVCLGFTNLTRIATRHRLYPLALRYLDEGLRYCDERDLDLYRPALLADKAQIDLDQGRWDEATEPIARVLADPGASPLARILALVAKGLVGARRGDADPWPALNEAWRLAQPTGELQALGAVAAARAEAFWLEANPDAIGEATEAAFALALRGRVAWAMGELAYWRRSGGIDERSPTGLAEPYAAQMAGDWSRAAGLWAELGCPYHAALALAEADNDDALHRALDELHLLGARPAAAIVAHRLRKRGARNLPRGPRPSTRQNPAQLTRRELEVLKLVCQGLQNAEIAERLFVSAKTIDHHVSASFRKLNVHTRTQASREATRLGLIDAP